jgi:2-oxoglutarate dehydrogenase E2 component (dihydrolipoamide succinyltransferase)
MAVVDIKVPGVGESVQEGMIESWRKSSGEWAEADDVLLELATDKATVEITAQAAGVVEILAEAGKVVKVGEVIGKIDTSASRPTGTSTPTAKVAPPPPKPAAQQVQENLSPAVRRMAAEGQGQPDKIAGTGRGGRVTKEDMVNQAATSVKAPTAPVAPAGLPPQPAVDLSAGSEQRIATRKPMSMLRRRIAERLITAQQTAAILTTFNEIDMTNIMAMRDRYKEAFQEKYNLKLGFMGFFLKASVEALKAFPTVNAYIDGTDIIYHSYCDVGVAVSTPKGLIVPVVRNADRLTIQEMERAIAGFGQKARDNKIAVDDLTGGTFTVSNGGVFGSLLSTPILNPPQSAILGMHKTQMRPIVLADGTIAARPMMYLALSYDHRIIDGKEAVGFLVKIKECCEDPSRMLLGV